MQFSIIERFNFPELPLIESFLRSDGYFDFKNIFTQFSATSASANWFVFALFRFVPALIEYLIKKYKTDPVTPVKS